MNIAKNYLIFSSIIFILLGAVLISLGSFINHLELEAFQLYPNLLSSYLIYLGVSLLFSGVISSLAIIRRCPILLIFYVVSTTILCIIESLTGIAAFILESITLNRILDSMQHGQLQYLRENLAMSNWNSIQKNLHCCGLDTYKEWYQHFDVPSAVPDSCCAIYSNGCGNRAVSTGNFYRIGCSTAIFWWFRSYSIVTGVLVVLLVVFRVLAIMCARVYLTDFAIAETGEV